MYTYNRMGKAPLDVKEEETLQVGRSGQTSDAQTSLGDGPQAGTAGLPNWMIC